MTSTIIFNEYSNDTITTSAIDYVTLAAALADAVNLSVGNVLKIKERVATYGGGGTWDVITDTGWAAANTYNIVATSVANVSLQLRIENNELDVSMLGYPGSATSASALLQYAMDSDYDLYIPPYQYRCVDVSLTKSKAIRWAEGATFKPIGSGTNVFFIDGSAGTIDGETGIAVKINRIAIDGGSRSFAIDGLKIDHLTRSEIDVVEVKNLNGTALNAYNSFRESRMNTLRTRDCGSWTNGTTYKAVVDFEETLTTGDAHNNIFINNWYSIYSRGPDLVIDSAAGRSTNPRKIHIENYMVHGHIAASDPGGNPLSPAEKADRIQIILGSCDQVTFGAGSVQFAATAAYPIHVTTGKNTSLDYNGGVGTPTYVGTIDFGKMRVHSRYDFASVLSNYDGLRLDAGTIYLNGISMGSGYTGASYDAIYAASNVNLYMNPFNQNIDTGTVAITDTETVYVRAMDIDFGSGDLNTIRTIRTGAASLEFREAQSGSDRKCLEIKNSTNAALGKAVCTSFLEQGTITLPSAANMISDSVGAALAYDGTNLRWFDGTIWKTVTVT